MLRATTFVLFGVMALGSVPARCQEGDEWDRARAQLAASQDGTMAQAIARWRTLSASDRFGFEDYAGFMLAWPGFPEEGKLRAAAERALERQAADPARIAAFFDRFPPLTNPARGQYALALMALGRPDARTQAVAAWRGGPMSDAAAATLFAQHGGAFSVDDHDARMDALLWAGALAQAQQQVGYVSPGRRAGFMARLALAQGNEPSALGLDVPPEALRDTGYVYNRVRRWRQAGDNGSAARMLATRPEALVRPYDPTRWVSELLAVARATDADTAVRIASSVDDAFAPGTDLSRAPFKLRDDYTSLMWLAGRRAMSDLGQPARAAPLFYRYGAAARTPQTRTKGFYWAGRALAQSGDTAGAARYFEMAAAFPDQFYGMLSLERLGRPLPRFANAPRAVPSPAERTAFEAKPLTAAVREVARGYDWPVTVRFFREISERAETEGEHVLVAELARQIGRRDLAVILGQSAHSDGFGDFQIVSFPLIPTPPGANWTMVHAISRQESQFAMNAISHAGARGLMQLMPGTAREQAGKIGLSYDMTALINDANYNIRLGDGYFGRMMDYYGGSYPLAVAAYNAGPGNVNRILRQNGDPRNGGIDWVEWIERIPITETRNYVQRVIENAVVYEAMNPTRATYKGPNPLSNFLGKRTPG